MNLALSGAAVLSVLAAIAFFFLFRRLVARERKETADLGLEWCRDFSAANYRPMERLFSEADYEFLAAQPGFSPKIRRKLHVERQRLFRTYLRCLSRDFDRLFAVAKLLLLHAPQDRPDLARALLKHRVFFWYAMAAVECRLLLHQLGIGKVDVQPLVSALERLRDQLRLLAQYAEPSGT